MVPDNIFPWQVQQWRKLWQCHRQNRLSHALLLTGASGLGKKHFAQTFARAVLCSNPSAEGKVCQACHACHLVNAEAHSDLMIVEPEKAGQMISIDQIRDVVKLANETALQSGFRVIIIHPASAMNMHAANALLKTLEEPTLNILFILINDQRLRIPATIVSRCQKIVFSTPKREVALQWLETHHAVTTEQASLLLNLTEGAPLAVLQFMEQKVLTLRQDFYQGLHGLSENKSDPLQLATQWQETDLVLVFHLLLSWLRDLLRVKLIGESVEVINYDYKNIFAQLQQKIARGNLLHYIEHVQQLYAKILVSLNLNRQLLLEDLFIRWSNASHIIPHIS